MSDRLWQDAQRDVQSFCYPVIPRPDMAPEVPGLGEGYKARDRALQQEIAAAVEAARKQGVQEGLAQANASAANVIDQERLGLAQALGNFAGSQKEYFRHVEGETVRLALAIARKVLHREAQMDPLLLAGVVRVALDQMQAGTRLTLRTSAESAATWAEFCREHLTGEHSVEVVPDDGLKSHECVLQAEMGSTKISLDAQLQEIEGGFFDLLREQVATQP